MTRYCRRYANATRAALILILAAWNMTSSSAAVYAISGGEVASGDQYPWAAFLAFGGEGCSGALIDPYWILTAAHCLRDGQGQVVIGRSNVRDGSTGEGYRTDQFIKHDSADLALVRLPSASRQQTVSYRTAQFPQGSRAGVLLGYGVSNPNDRTSFGTLRRLAIDRIVRCEPLLGLYGPVLCTGDALTAFRDAFVDSIEQVFALFRDRYQSNLPPTPCRGDSGGPLVVDGNIAGVVSRANPSAVETCYSAMIYVDVGSYYDWIVTTIASSGGPGRGGTSGGPSMTITPSCGAPGTQATVRVTGLPSNARIPWLGPDALESIRRGNIADPVVIPVDAQGTYTWTGRFQSTQTVEFGGASATFTVPCASAVSSSGSIASARSMQGGASRALLAPGDELRLVLDSGTDSGGAGQANRRFPGPYLNFIAELDAQLVRPSQNGYIYLTFRHAHSEEGRRDGWYTLELDPNRQAVRWTGGGYTARTIVEWTYNPAIRRGSEWNHILMRVQDQGITVSVNGQQVIQAQDTSGLAITDPGALIISTATDWPHSEVGEGHIRSLTVTDLAAAPSTPPTRGQSAGSQRAASLAQAVRTLQPQQTLERLVASPLSAGDLPTGFSAPRVSTPVIGAMQEEFHALGSAIVDLRGPAGTYRSSYVVYNTEEDASGFITAMEQRSVGTIKPAGFSYPVLCLPGGPNGNGLGCYGQVSNVIAGVGASAPAGGERPDLAPILALLQAMVSRIDAGASGP
jgi:hypothetical protein